MLHMVRIKNENDEIYSVSVAPHIRVTRVPEGWMAHDPRTNTTLNGYTRQAILRRVQVHLSTTRNAS